MNQLRAGFGAFALFSVLLPAAAAAQACPPREIARPPAGQTADLVFTTVRYLADDALAGRGSGTAGERCAGDFIAAEFRRLGLRPGGDGGTYFQDVSIASAANPHATAGTGRNVVAVLEGSDPALRSEAIVIGAHYDHLGRETTFSLSPDSVNAIHNGADDNASGVAALLAAAERLAQLRPARSIVFVAFTGEEHGLLGASHYVSNPAIPVERTRAMLNMDMVGRLGAGPLVIYGIGTAEEWPALVAGAAEAEGIPTALQPDGYGASDHTAFYLRDIPVLHFFTNVHTDYHRPTDDWQKVDFDGLRRVSALVTRVAADVASDRPALALIRGVGTPPGRASSSGYGAYLGTVPDFAPVERGVKLAGVTPGSPAETAGLRSGDVLVGFAGQPVADLYAFTDALRAHRPGDTVEITVLRDGAEVTVQAVLGSR